MITQRPAPTNVLTRSLSVLVVLFGLALTRPVAARDMTGKGGFGVLQPIGDGARSTPTLFAFRYWRTRFAFELLAGFDTSPDVLCPQTETSDATGTVATPVNCGARQSSVRGGAAILWRLVDSRQISASVGARGWFILDHLRDGDSRFGTVLELPFQVEYFLNDNASVQAGVGPVLLSLGNFDAGGVGTSLVGNATNGVQILIGGRYSGGAGFTYYF